MSISTATINNYDAIDAAPSTRTPSGTSYAATPLSTRHPAIAAWSSAS